MKSVKKEQLEKGLAEMKELGMGGLSKGLSFLRQKSASYGQLDEEKPPAGLRASSFSNMTDKPKMSYDELLSLSMKLTKQNRAYKAQMTAASDKLFRLNGIEANYNLMLQFVSDDVGIDVVYEQPTEISLDDSAPAEIENTLNIAAMRQQYHDRDSVREGHVRDMESVYVQEIASLKAQLEKLQTSAPEPGDDEKKDDVVVAAPGPSPVESNLRFEIETLKSSITMERRLREEADRSWQLKLRESEEARNELSETIAKAQAEVASLTSQLESANATATSYASDIQSQLLVNQQREESLTALKRELQNQAQLTQKVDGLQLSITQKDADIDKLSKTVHQLEQQLIAKDTELKTTIGKLLTAERERSQLQELADTAMAKHTHLEAELKDFQLLQGAKESMEREMKVLRAKLNDAEQQMSTQSAEVTRLAGEITDLHKKWSEKSALSTRLHTENLQLAEQKASQAAEIAQLKQQLASGSSDIEKITQELENSKSTINLHNHTIASLQQELTSTKATYESRIATLEKEWSDEKASLLEASEQEILNIKHQYQQDMERHEADARTKSKLARQLVLEKEEMVANLSAQLAQLEHDVKSGDADHRRIFELASMQAQRGQEVQELVNTVAEKQADIDALKQQIKIMEEEISVLVRTERREGVNMEYLKNVVVQYMSFRPGSSQQMKLIPVLSTLLQFSPHDMEEIKAATKRSSGWGSWTSEKKPIKTIVAPPTIIIPRGKGAYGARSPRSSPRNKARSPKHHQENTLLHNSDSIDL